MILPVDSLPIPGHKSVPQYPTVQNMLVNNRLAILLAPAFFMAATTASWAQKAPSAPTASSSSAPSSSKKASAPAADTAPIQISLTDPAILDSIKKAQATLDKFLPIATKNDPNNQAVSMKVAIRDGKKVEHIWVMPFASLGKNHFNGKINEKPEVVRNVKEGQQWIFSRDDVVDWMYYDTAGAKMHGNYSTCAKLTKGPKADRDEMKRMYGLECGK